LSLTKKMNENKTSINGKVVCSCGLLLSGRIANCQKCAKCCSSAQCRAKGHQEGKQKAHEMGANIQAPPPTQFSPELLPLSQSLVSLSPLLLPNAPVCAPSLCVLRQETREGNDEDIGVMLKHVPPSLLSKASLQHVTPAPASSSQGTGDSDDDHW